MRKVNRRILYGFTIAELLITMAVLGFVMMLSVPIIGMKKAKDPNYTNVPHGTFECYYEGDTLHAYQADSTENQSGSEVEITSAKVDGIERDACAFTLKSTTSILLQAVGAGGNAQLTNPLVKLSDSFVDGSAENRDGVIRTDDNFKSDLAAAPGWVRRCWNNFWAENSGKYVKYTVTSPVGKGGEYKAGTVIKSDDPECEPCWNGGSVCPAKCNKSASAKGGRSARQGKVVLKKQIFQSEDITSEISESRTFLSFSANNHFSFNPSNPGDPAYKSGNSYENGDDGRDFDYSSETRRGYAITSKKSGYENSALKIESTGFNEVRNAGSVSAAGNKNLKVTPGAIIAEPTEIPYSSNGTGANISFTPAGEPGKFVQKFYEKLPAGTDLLLVPAKTSAEHSLLLVRPTGTTGFNILAIAESGKNSVAESRAFRIDEENDLPFPGGLYPDLFGNVQSGFVVTGSNKYLSKVAEILRDGTLQPGRSGYGIYPIIEYFRGESTYSIWGEKVRPIIGSILDDNYALQLSAPINKCLDGSEPINGNAVLKLPGVIKVNATANKYCKSSTTGNPGAVVVSW